MIDTKVIVPVAATIPQQEPSVEQKKKTESSQVPPTFGQIGFRANGFTLPFVIVVCMESRLQTFLDFFISPSILCLIIFLSFIFTIIEKSHY